MNLRGRLPLSHWDPYGGVTPEQFAAAQERWRFLLLLLAIAGTVILGLVVLPL